MAVIAAANEIWQVTQKMRLDNQEVLNVLHFATPAGDNDVVQHLLKALIDCFLLQFLAGASSGLSVELVKGHRIFPDIGPEYEYVPPGTSVSNNGSLDTDSMPSFVSAVVSIHTTRGGRSGRGRMYLAGMPESSVQHSRITVPSAFWTALINYVACVVAAFLLGDPPPANAWQLGVFSRKLGNSAPPFLAAGFAPATLLIPHAELATTRSRKIGHGS